MDNDINAGWARMEVYVLKTLETLLQKVETLLESQGEQSRKLVALDAKFDRYNNFNEKLSEVKGEVEIVKKEVHTISARVALIIGGISFGASAFANIAIAWFK